MQPFRKLVVWQKAHQLTLDLYRHTAKFPSDERYGLTSQIRRSAVSICANLAEGCGRHTRREFARFACIAVGSASELEYHLLLAADLGIMNSECYSPVEKAVVEVKRMLAGLIRKLMTDDR